LADHPRTILSILDLTTPKHSEVLELLAAQQTGAEVRLFSTSETPEHRILAIAGRPVIVAPLTDPGELSGSRVVVTCSKPASPWDRQLVDWLGSHPEILWLDLSRPTVAGTAATPVMRSRKALPEQGSWLYLPDPGLAGPLTVLDVLADLEPVEVAITAFQPCCDFGDEGLQELAAQARARLTGAKPLPGATLQSVLAFDLAPAAQILNAELERQATNLFPSLAMRIRVVRSGVFFGHTCWMMIQCRNSLRVTRVRELLGADSTVRVTRDPDMVTPSAVVDQSGIMVFAPEVAGNRLNLWVAADGEVLLGARAIADILGRLINA
jgi:hypothetical protein